MKKIKLLTSTAALTALGGCIIPITSCNKGSVEKIKLTFMAGEGGTISTGIKTVELDKATKWGSIENKPTPVAKDGYHFVGWYRGDSQMTDETEISSTIDVYAYFEKDVPGQCYVTVIAGIGSTFGSGTTKLIATATGTKWSNLGIEKPTTTDDNLQFDAWYLDDNTKITEDTIITRNCYIFGWFEPKAKNHRVIKFYASTGGTSFGDDKYVIFEKGTKWSELKSKAPSPESGALTGYKFNNWYVGDEEVRDVTIFNESGYCVAYYEPTKIVLNLTAGENGKIQSGKNVQEIGVGRFNTLRYALDKVVIPDTGYILDHWENAEGVAINDDDYIDNTKTIKAIFAPERFTYVKNESAKIVHIASVTGTCPKNLVIPTYTFVDGIQYQVASTKDGVFQNNKDVETLSIPASFTYLSSWAYQGMTNLKKIIFPDSIKKIWRAALRGCTSLTQIKFLGTREKYYAIERVYYWHENCPTSTVSLIDGTTCPLEAE